MMSRFLRRGPLVVVLMVVAACTGLYFDKGNAYPCDFSQGPGLRDLACVEGDVCGSDDLCRAFIYEGPRFEGVPKVPTFAPSEFATIHPLTLDGPVVFIARPPSGEDNGAMIVAMEDGGIIVANQRGQLSQLTGLSQTNLVVPRIEHAYFARTTVVVDGGVAAGTYTGQVLAGIFNGRLSFAATFPPPLNTFGSTTGDLADVFRIAAPVQDPDLTAPRRSAVMQAVGEFGRAGEVELVVRPQPQLRIGRPYDIGAALAVDVGVLTRNPNPRLPLMTPVVLTRDELYQQQPDGGFEPVIEFNSVARALRFNGAGTVMVVELQGLARDGGASVLSTWQVGATQTVPREHVLEPAWPDCDPCARGRMVRAAPVPPQEGLAVEVLCQSDEGEYTLHRVTGSVAVVDSDYCITDELPFPFDERRVNLVDGKPVGAEGQVGVAVGGVSGEVWLGETLSRALPVGLERVPVDVFTVATPGEPTLGALTSNYFAALQPPTVQVPVGFRRVDSQEDFDSAEQLSFLASVHNTTGWGLLDDGTLVRVEVGEADSGIHFGATLTTSTGDPIRRTAGGEAFEFTDGGLGAIFVAADDGLYFVPSPNTNESDVSPQLQPEPSVPIRSLALERTPLGTGTLPGEEAITRARGYLVTSRNVFEWSFGGSPARWSSRPLAIAAGEPVEVWFDTKKSALGRVGFSDGRIFTLPGGYQLANAIPGDAGTTIRLIDYENFGGWPVALATNGLFIARWELENGKLQNKFPDGTSRPMEWEEIFLPDDTRPWMEGDETEGKLFVQQDDLPDKQRRFRLYVFLPDRVLQVGDFTR